MKETKQRSIRVTDEVWERLNGVPGTINEVLEGLLSHICVTQSSAPDTRIDELIELARSQPSTEDVENIIDAALQRKIDERAARTGQQVTNPASITGVQRGMPRRESGYERAQREKLEAEERVRALDSVDDESIDRSAEFVSA